MVFTVHGTEHQNYSDTAVWTNVSAHTCCESSTLTHCLLYTQFVVAKNRTIGSLEPRMATRAINSFASQFLQQHCLQRPAGGKAGTTAVSPHHVSVSVGDGAHAGAGAGSAAAAANGVSADSSKTEPRLPAHPGISLTHWGIAQSSE